MSRKVAVGVVIKNFSEELIWIDEVGTIKEVMDALHKSTGLDPKHMQIHVKGNLARSFHIVNQGNILYVDYPAELISEKSKEHAKLRAEYKQIRKTSAFSLPPKGKTAVPIRPVTPDAPVSETFKDAVPFQISSIKAAGKNENKYGKAILANESPESLFQTSPQLQHVLREDLLKLESGSCSPESFMSAKSHPQTPLTLQGLNSIPQLTEEANNGVDSMQNNLPKIKNIDGGVTAPKLTEDLLLKQRFTQHKSALELPSNNNQDNLQIQIPDDSKPGLIQFIQQAAAKKQARSSSSRPASSAGGTWRSIYFDNLPEDSFTFESSDDIMATRDGSGFPRYNKKPFPPEQAHERAVDLLFQSFIRENKPKESEIQEEHDVWPPSKDPNSLLVKVTFKSAYAQDLDIWMHPENSLYSVSTIVRAHLTNSGMKSTGDKDLVVYGPDPENKIELEDTVEDIIPDKADVNILEIWVRDENGVIIKNRNLLD